MRMIGFGGREETVVGRSWRGRRRWSAVEGGWRGERDVRERERGERDVNEVRGRKMWCGGCKKVFTCVQF